MRDRDRWLLAAALVAFALWLAVLGPVRTWAKGAGLRANWAIGVAPSFLAGATFALWQAFAVRSRPVAAVAGSAVLIVIAEVVQIGLPRYTADVWDAIAGILGAGLVLPLLVWRSRRHAPPIRRSGGDEFSSGHNAR